MKPVFQKFELKNISTDKFVMTPVELKDYIDFEVKRVYFISSPREDAGGHCHKREKEFFILQQGSCTAIIDQGEGKEEITMTGGSTAIYIGNYVWHYFKDLSSDAILLALSSTNYDPTRSDYIENYEDYKKLFSE